MLVLLISRSLVVFLLYMLLHIHCLFFPISDHSILFSFEINLIPPWILRRHHTVGICCEFPHFRADLDPYTSSFDLRHRRRSKPFDHPFREPHNSDQWHSKRISFSCNQTHLAIASVHV